MTEIPRRTMLRGAAFSALAAGVPGLPAARGAAEADLPVGNVAVVQTRAALAARTPVRTGEMVYLSEAGYAGMFRVARAPGVEPRDALYGLSVPCAQAGFWFVREWDGTHGRPEWFGARPGDPAFDCADAIEACYALCPVTELAAADYFTRRTVRFARGGRSVRGVGAFAETAGQGTRIVLHRAAPGVSSDDVMLVGSVKPVAVPGDQAAADCHFSNFTLVRDGACTPHPSGDIALYPAGLRASFVFHCTFAAIASLESSVGFYIGGVVYTKFDDCYALRTRAGTSAQRDYCVGYYLNGHVSFGYAGGNASVYLNRCLVSDQHPQHVDATGLLARGAFVDTFLDGFESARIATGIACRADGARGIGNTVDLHIRTPVLDNCTRGIEIDLGGTTSASIDITGAYIYASASGGICGIAVHDGAGQVTLDGGQVHGGFGDGSISLSRVRGVRIQGVKIQQAPSPLRVEDSSALVLEPQINNVDLASPGFAVSCRATSRSSVRPIVTGAGGVSFAGGVDLDARCHHVQVDGTAIDPACFKVADAAGKVRFGGGDARAGGAAKAFEAAGNRLVGVTD